MTVWGFHMWDGSLSIWQGWYAPANCGNSSQCLELFVHGSLMSPCLGMKSLVIINE